jgi:hypothetical protein
VQTEKEEQSVDRSDKKGANRREKERDENFSEECVHEEEARNT